jgi:cytochrome c-type biogenesis protein CcmH/NrfF
MSARAYKSWPAWLGLGVVLLVALIVGVAQSGGASTPAERIDAIAKTVKCPVCPGESVYESRNSVAINIKNEIAREVRAGRTDDEIRAALAERFGDSILLVPRASGVDSLVWVLPVVVLVVGLVGLGLAFRRWRRETVEAGDPSADDRALVAAALRVEDDVGGEG